MKNTITTLIFALFIVAASVAQTPIIKDFRTVIKDIPNDFETLKSEMTEDGKDETYKLYTTTLDDSPICDSFIFESATGERVFILSYNVKKMDSMMFKIFNTMVPQYLNEMNDMVKTGNYKGEDYNDNGTSITEITDLKGKIIVQYRSTADEHRIMFYGSK